MFEPMTNLTRLTICFYIGLMAVCEAVSAQAPAVSLVSGLARLPDGKPAVHASITCSTAGKTVIADEQGRFEMMLAPGKYKLTCSITGYELVSMQVQVYAGAAAVANFALQKQKFGDLKEVVVKGATAKQVIEKQGFAVNVIETREAALRNTQTNELLDRTVGVRVRQNGGMGSAVTYNLNGMSGNSVRIFIDGIPVSTYGASFSLNSIPPALIERIEVYKGVIPAHLADDALGGAINVVLKKGMRKNLTASVSYGSFNTFQASATGMFRNSKNGFTLKGSGFYNNSDNDYEVWGKFVRNILPNGRYEYVRARRFNDAYRSVGGRVEAGFTDVKWADQFLVGYNGSDDYNEIQHGTYMSIPYKGRFSKSQSHVFSVNYRKKNFLTEGLELSFNGMYSSRSEVITDTVRYNYNWFGEKSLGLDGQPILTSGGAQQGAPTINHVDRNVTTFRAGLNYDINRNHRIVLNNMFYMIDRRQQDLMRSAAEREFVGTRDLGKNILSLAYEMNAFESRLRTNLFGKYYRQKIDRMDPVLTTLNGEQVKTEDRISSNKTTAGYGLALSYAVIPTVTVLGSAEKAVRMPSEGEVFGSPGENIVENIGIRPETSNNLNLGVKAGPYYFNKHKVSLSVSGFLRDTRDKIVQRINTRLNDAVQTNPYENLGKTKAIGFEAEAGYTFNNNLHVLVNMSRFNSVFNIQYDPNGREYDYYNRQLPNEPFFTVNSTVQYSFHELIQKNSVLNLYYNAGFVERFYTTWLLIEDFRTPRQFIQDMGASYMFPGKKFVVSVDMKNIFDRQAYDNFAVQKPGRAIYLKLNYSINNF